MPRRLPTASSRSANHSWRARHMVTEEDQFFRQQNRLWIFNAVVILRIAPGRVITGPVPFYQYCGHISRPTSGRKLAGGFSQSVHQGCRDEDEGLQWYRCRRFSVGGRRLAPRLAALADRTRTSIAAGIFGILHVATTGIVREMCSGTTNCSPDTMLQQGKSILINMPFPQYGPSGPSCLPDGGI